MVGACCGLLRSGLCVLWTLKRRALFAGESDDGEEPDGLFSADAGGDGHAVSVRKGRWLAGRQPFSALPAEDTLLHQPPQAGQRRRTPGGGACLHDVSAAEPPDARQDIRADHRIGGAVRPAPPLDARL